MSSRSRTKTRLSINDDDEMALGSLARLLACLLDSKIIALRKKHKAKQEIE